MPEKKVLQDMVRVKVHRIHTEPEPETEPKIVSPKRKQRQPDAEPFRHFNKRRRMLRRRTIFGIVLALVICCASIYVIFTYIYDKAVVVVTPKTADIMVNGAYNAAKDTAPFPYQIIQTNEIASTTVQATQGPSVEKKAWGQIIITNNYSSSSQKLPQGTLLSNNRGQLYVTANPVTVPGIHKTDTGTTTGSASVYIVAKDAGAQYNMTSHGPNDSSAVFRVESFANTPKYTAITGSLKPNGSLVGGYLGYTQIIATSSLASAVTSLSQTISSELTSDLHVLVPDGYVLYNNAYAVNFATSTTAMISSTTASVTVTGILYGIMFKKTDIMRNVAPNQMAEFPANSYTLSGVESLVFTPINPSLFTANLKNQSGDAISFALNGHVKITGTFQKDSLIKALSGVPVADSKAIFNRYSTIGNARAIITPFWRHTFPDSVSKITIDTQ